MATHLRKTLLEARPRRRGLLRMLGAAAIALTCSGCLDGFFALLFGTLYEEQFHTELSVSVSPEEGVRGSLVPAILTFDPGLPGPVPDPNDGVRLLSVFLVDEDGREPTGVSLSPTQFEAGMFEGNRIPRQLSVTLTLAPDSPARPVSIRLYATKRDAGLPPATYHYEGAARFFVRRNETGAAPRLTGITGDVEPGETNSIVFHGSSFDRTATFTPRNAAGGTTLTDLSDLGPGRVRAMLTLPANAPTGLLSFSVSTPAGESNRAALNVHGVRPDPTLAGPFPNHAAAGSDSIVQLAGENLATGALVVTENPANLLIGEASLSSPFLMRQTFHPTGLPRTESLRINSLGRLTGAADFHVEPANFQGPRIRLIFIPFGHLVAGTRNPIEISWDNLRNDVAPTLVVPPNAQQSEPVSSAAVLRAEEAPPQPFSVAALDVAPIDTADTVWIAARTADGLTTNLVEARVEPPDSRRPFLQSAMLGRVVRGGEITETIFGERLTDAHTVLFLVPGCSGEIIRETVTATSLQLRVRAADDTPLAGDALNYIQILSPAGASNPLAYTVAGGSAGNPPIIDTLAPNWGYRNNSGEIHIAGANFSASDSVSFTPAGGPETSQIQVLDGSNLRLSYFYFGPTPQVAALGVIVSNAAGASNPGSLKLLTLPIERGPEIFGLSPLTLTASVRSQVSVGGAIALTAGGPSSVLSLGSEFGGESSANGRFYPPVTPGNRLQGVMEIDPYLAPGLTEAQVRLVVRRSDGLTSNAIPVTIVAPPATGPLITRVRISGDLQRGTTRGVSIEGRRLNGAVELAIDAPGVTYRQDFFVNADGTELTTGFTAAADAALTGDAPTTVQVVTPAGVSPRAGFVVVP